MGSGFDLPGWPVRLRNGVYVVLTRSIGILACVAVLDCLTGAFSFLNPWFPLPPAGEASWETKLVIGLIAFCVLAITALRGFIAVVSFLLTRTGWLGREFGLAMIRGLTAEKGRSWARDTLVRWLWSQVGTRKLKSVAAIAKRARGEMPVRRTNPIPEHVLVQTERDAYRGDNIIPIGFKPTRRAA